MFERDQIRQLIDELDSSIAEMEPLAAEFPSVEMTVKSMQFQRNDLEAQLEALRRTTAVLRFDGQGVHGHEMKVGTLGRLLTSFQQTISALGQSIVARATRVGPLDRNVLAATELAFAGSFAGSVGIELKARDTGEDERLIDTDTLLDTATKQLIGALDQVARGVDEDILLETVLPWGSRTYKHLRQWAEYMSQDELSAYLWVKGETGQEASVQLSGRDVARLTSALDRNVISETVETIEGHLGTVSDFRNRVEIVTDGRRILTARVDDSLVPELGQYFSREVRAVIELNTTKSRATGLERTYRLIRELSLARDD